MTIINSKKRKKAKGQSLVELAISLPLFLMLIAGIVEVGNLLVQRQRITTATDMAVRFGSRGGSDEGIRLSSYAVLTQTMPIDNLALWDVFVVRGTVNDEGTGWVDNSFEVNPVYGGGESDLYRDVISSTYPISLGISILDGLQTRIDPENNVVFPAGGGNQAGRDQAAGEEIVGVIMSYRAETILGIEDYFGQDVELITEKYMTIHAVSNQTDGCDIYPIAISSAVRNKTRGEEADGQNYYLHTTSNYQPLVEGIGTNDLFDFPALDETPHWSDFRVIGGDRTTLDPAPYEGDIYVMYEGDDFEWVFFGNDPGTSTTAIDMVWPGNSRIYDAYNFTFPDSSPGQGLHIGDRIKHSTNNAVENNQGRAANAWSSLNPHISAQRSIRVPIIRVDQFGTTATSDNFPIAGFLIVKILGYGTGDGSNAGKRFMVVEAVKLDTSCGQSAN